MSGLPPLLAEDVEGFERILRGLLGRSEAVAALLIDQGGPLITQAGDWSRFDTVTLAALAAGAFAATQGVAMLLGETEFGSVYQQGRALSVIVNRVDDNLLLIVIFKATLSAGLVKYYAAASVAALFAQINLAAARAPGQAIDLVSLDLGNASDLFRRKKPDPS
jgi:predicted regulator of Ras-like GTPase activity (Roadblock/LC7/MglB family)